LIPIRLLWSLRLFSRSLHIRLVSVFGMSLATTAVSLCQNYYQIRDGGVRDFIVSHVEVSLVGHSFPALPSYQGSKLIASFDRPIQRYSYAISMSSQVPFITGGAGRLKTSITPGSLAAVRVSASPLVGKVGGIG